ncbi:uncharacterized protein LOC144882465 [Branchiostoma floridae x Branchiostoma japonicum]
MWTFLLFIAAVIVWPGSARGENIALGKSAFQTSTVPNGDANHAVDGNTNTNYGSSSCSSTFAEDNPSWWVDLGETHIIDRVDIFYRQDCYGEQLSPFNIHIGDSPRVTENFKCAGPHHIDPHQPFTAVGCGGMRGRYVGVRLPGPSRILTICEVQISGEIDECATDPCVHGDCSDAIGDYTCTCHSGWEGRNCDTDIDECAFSPCSHGICTDTMGSYTCSCETGWTGINCQDIDECLSSPCVHGTCRNYLGSYTCSCEIGWEGTNCDQDKDWCHPNPCNPGEVCEDWGLYYICIHQHGYRGLPYKCSSDSCLDGMYCTPEGVGRYSCKPE